MKQLYKNAIDVQDACNLSGIVHSFSRDISRLRELNPGMGTDEINSHAICVLYSDKIRSLVGDDFSKAYNEAMEAIK
jgi:uncharacterized protein YqkB